jgi:hypothetical protein
VDLKSEFSRDQIYFEVEFEKKNFKKENKNWIYYKSVNIPKIKISLLGKE